ncbi:hypothetical protein DVR14_02150 [Natrinema thermotolerans]|nr:hypothetical protein DVR14_02150 [Natrinema thermotolerans]
MTQRPVSDLLALVSSLLMVLWLCLFSNGNVLLAVGFLGLAVLSGCRLFSDRFRAVSADRSELYYAVLTLVALTLAIGVAVWAA